VKTYTRYCRSLPSPLKVSCYIAAVIAFCFVDWKLMKADHMVQHNTPSFESYVIEYMFEEMDPVSLPETRNLSTALEDALGVEPWMIKREAFIQVEADGKPAPEDWMIDLSAWSVH
jgi:hypothetical protein